MCAAHNSLKTNYLNPTSFRQLISFSDKMTCTISRLRGTLPTTGRTYGGQCLGTLARRRIHDNTSPDAMHHTILDTCFKIPRDRKIQMIKRCQKLPRVSKIGHRVKIENKLTNLEKNILLSFENECNLN